MSLTNLEYWNTNAFSFDAPATQLWLTFAESNVLWLVAQDERAARRPAPVGCELLLRAYRSAT